ncbi:AsnC family transcriptional regulator [Marivirga tractuosa]|uniref:Transcriptional regulator, AsnC family n=1 Tax=Marivirga tractuosa (strain ATCC 23168 / DSM 4126 / NBRC 15989 / NCIMB 1408 / VKM B-1430 / H-43) TaxID=643867 RepID=E4TRH9_MARTH|nr:MULTISPECIES: Lrp/AsnC ligand binding domain-containing protein [Marivirga]ADR21700.1 transcriptional regulator, AsnC family [Marivirga tractuosa DSM 4126]BDD13842.1 AsnC family transcriptional regulator [Marivirga tractuosa]HET8859458.1 Lrp/AsnC ligand binding domain-containing protein [Marivirga sp.]
MENYQLDNTDLAILNILMQDARRPFTEVAEEVFVSPGTVHVRMRKMEKLGLIKNSQLQVDLSKLGLDVTAFLGVYLQKSSLYDEVVAALKAIPEIVDCHYTTGAYSMFVKIVCRDTNHLKNILHDFIQPIEGIERTETFISLEESINRQVQLNRK